MVCNHGTTWSWQSWLPLFVPIVVAFLAYCFGLRAYRQQREYELARQRYLGEGVDLVASRLEEALSAYRHNWFQGLQIVKYMKHLGAVPEDMLDRSHFIMPEPSQLETRANYRLTALVGDPVFYHVQQLALAFAESASAFIRDDLCAAARGGVKDVKVAVSPQEAAEESMKQLTRLSEESQRHSWVIGQLQALAAFLEEEHFSFRQLEKFRERPEVKAVVRAVREKYKDELGAGDPPAVPLTPN